MIANYHTHTSRCGHAGADTDEAYVEAAIAAGFKILGFSDHCPWPYKNGFDASKTRMRMEDLPGYFASVRGLKEKYREKITIYAGLECEYYEEYQDALKEMAGMADYLIFGCHWTRSEEYGQKSTGSSRLPEQLEECAENMIKGMESGLFRYLNHPCHMLCSYPVFDSHCEAAAKKICETAKKWICL